MIKDPTLETWSKSVPPIKINFTEKASFPKTSSASSIATRYYSELQIIDQDEEMNCVPVFTVP